MSTETIIQQLPPLNDDIKNILGRPNFAVAGIARRLHELGLYVVPTKSEEEQAAALHWMLNLYFAHGDKWAEEGNKILFPSTQPHPATQEETKP